MQWRAFSLFLRHIQTKAAVYQCDTTSLASACSRHQHRGPGEPAGRDGEAGGRGGSVYTVAGQSVLDRGRQSAVLARDGRRPGSCLQEAEYDVKQRARHGTAGHVMMQLCHADREHSDQATMERHIRSEPSTVNA